MKSMFKATVSDAYNISVISMVFTVIAFVAGLLISIATKSAATLGYSLENLVDSISSALVLWRFWGGGKTVPIEELEQREKRASIAIGVTFIFLAVAVVAVAGQHLANSEEPDDPLTLMILSIPSVIVFGVLGIGKLWLGSRAQLDSSSLRKDGLCSVCGSLLSVAVLVSSSLQYAGDGIWWLDGAAAVAISAGLFVVGMRTMVHNALQGNRFWDPRFWTMDSKRYRESLPQGGSSHKAIAVLEVQNPTALTAGGL